MYCSYNYLFISSVSIRLYSSSNDHISGLKTHSNIPAKPGQHVVLSWPSKNSPTFSGHPGLPWISLTFRVSGNRERIIWWKAAEKQQYEVDRSRTGTEYLCRHAQNYSVCSATVYQDVVHWNRITDTNHSGTLLLTPADESTATYPSYVQTIATLFL